MMMDVEWAGFLFVLVLGICVLLSSFRWRLSVILCIFGVTIYSAWLWRFTIWRIAEEMGIANFQTVLFGASSLVIVLMIAQLLRSGFVRGVRVPVFVRCKRE
ncbi:hypothetical protein C4577_02710 [Candidatus Parcubacteria bacterium]|nr:MAG: hypothetical protein C4577_02710 [Candidatus Parcubacteria bacterium]